MFTVWQEYWTDHPYISNNHEAPISQCLHMYWFYFNLGLILLHLYCILSASIAFFIVEMLCWITCKKIGLCLMIAIWWLCQVVVQIIQRFMNFSIGHRNMDFVGGDCSEGTQLFCGVMCLRNVSIITMALTAIHVSTRAGEGVGPCASMWQWLKLLLFQMAVCNIHNHAGVYPFELHTGQHRNGCRFTILILGPILL